MKNARGYIVGYVLSLVLTLAAFGLVAAFSAGTAGVTKETMLLALLVLAVAQLFVQMVFFLHLGEERPPRWNSIIFAFTVFTVLVIVGGSMWIMSHLTHQTHSAVEVFADENIPLPEDAR